MLSNISFNRKKYWIKPVFFFPLSSSLKYQSRCQNMLHYVSFPLMFQNDSQDTYFKKRSSFISLGKRWVFKAFTSTWPLKKGSWTKIAPSLKGSCCGFPVTKLPIIWGFWLFFWKEWCKSILGFSCPTSSLHPWIGITCPFLSLS